MTDLLKLPKNAKVHTYPPFTAPVQSNFPETMDLVLSSVSWADNGEQGIVTAYAYNADYQLQFRLRNLEQGKTYQTNLPGDTSKTLFFHPTGAPPTPGRFGTILVKAYDFERRLLELEIEHTEELRDENSVKPLAFHLHTSNFVLHDQTGSAQLTTKLLNPLQDVEFKDIEAWWPGEGEENFITLYSDADDVRLRFHLIDTEAGNTYDVGSRHVWARLTSPKHYDAFVESSGTITVHALDKATGYLDLTIDIASAVGKRDDSEAPFTLRTQGTHLEFIAVNK